MASYWSALRQEITATVDDFREKGAIGALKDAALDAKDITAETGGWLWGGVKDFVAVDDERPQGQEGQEREAGAVQSIFDGLKQEVRETVQEFQEKGAVGALKDAALDAVDIAKSAGSMAVTGAKTIAFGEEHYEGDDLISFGPPLAATAPATSPVFQTIPPQASFPSSAAPVLPTVPAQQSFSSSPTVVPHTSNDAKLIQSVAPVVPHLPIPQSSSSSPTVVPHTSNDARLIQSVAPEVPHLPIPQSSSSSSTATVGSNLPVPQSSPKTFTPLVPASPDQPRQPQQQQQQPSPEGAAKQAEVEVQAAPAMQTEEPAKPVPAEKTDSAAEEAKPDAQRVTEKAEKESTTPAAGSGEVAHAPVEAQVEELSAEEEQPPGESQKQDAQAEELFQDAQGEESKAGEKADAPRETRSEGVEARARRYSRVESKQEVESGKSGSGVPIGTPRNSKQDVESVNRWGNRWFGWSNKNAQADKAASAAPAPAQEAAQAEKEADDDEIID